MIGKTVWVFDGNRRVYEKPAPGRIYSSGPPIWIKHWDERKVSGETTQSWILDDGRKVPKKSPPSWIAFDWDVVKQREWIHENRHKIARAIDVCADYNKLQAIAAVLSDGIKRGN